MLRSAQTNRSIWSPHRPCPHLSTSLQNWPLAGSVLFELWWPAQNGVACAFRLSAAGRDSGQLHTETPNHRLREYLHDNHGRLQRISAFYRFTNKDESWEVAFMLWYSAQCINNMDQMNSQIAVSTNTRTWLNREHAPNLSSIRANTDTVHKCLMIYLCVCTYRKWP